MEKLTKHITELFAVIILNLTAWFAPLEAALKILVLVSTLIFTIVQTINVIIVIKKRREDARRQKTD